MIDETYPTPAGDRGKRGMQTIAPTTRLTVAFPFSKISLQGRDEDIVALAAVVEQLASIVAKSAPGKEIESVRERAHAIASRAI